MSVLEEVREVINTIERKKFDVYSICSKLPHISKPAIYQALDRLVVEGLIKKHKINNMNVFFEK